MHSNTALTHLVFETFWFISSKPGAPAALENRPPARTLKTVIFKHSMFEEMLCRENREQLLSFPDILIADKQQT